MKTTIIFILSFILLDLYSQDSKQYSFNLNFGTINSTPFKRKINSNEGNDSYTTKYRSSFGYFLDFMIDHKLNNHFSISGGLNFNQSRINIIRYNYYAFGYMLHSTDEASIRTSYFTFPIMFKYKLSNRLPITFGLGAYFSFITYAKEFGNSTINYTNQVINYNTKILDQYAPQDLGVCGQFNFNLLSIKNATIQLFIRYNLGLINVTKIEATAKGPWKNYNLLVGLGIKL